MFSSATIFTLLRSHLEHLRTPSSASVLGRVRLGRPPAEYLGAHLAHGIVQANPQQRLAGVLQNVDYLLLRVFQVDALAVGKQMIIGAIAHSLGQPPPKLLLQEFDDAADALQRHPLAPERTDDGNLSQVFDRIKPVAALPLRDYHLALVPPLQLARSDARQPHHLR